MRLLSVSMTLLAVLSVLPHPAFAQSPGAELPADVRIGFVDFQRVAASSMAGKQATARLEEVRNRRAAELEERTRQLQALELKLKESPSLLNDRALTSLQREVERTRVELQRFAQDAQEELRTLESDLQETFFGKLFL